MDFALVQGKIDGKSTVYIVDDLVIQLDEEIYMMYPEDLKLDYVANQGFRLLTVSQYLATHLTVLEDMAQY